LRAEGQKNHKDKSCKPVESCPAPVLEKPAPICAPCCPLPSVQNHCEAPAQTGCCPVDPKEVAKAQKEALHAQHEAAEACHRRQEAIAKAQQKLDDAYESAQDKIDSANSKFNDKASDLQDANAKYEAFYGGSGTSEPATAEVTPLPEPTPQPEMPTPSAEVTQPEPQQQQTIATVIVPAQPAQTPEPAKELPRTAGEMDLIGLLGLASLTGGYLTRFFRR
jgi:hypothetical protein